MYFFKGEQREKKLRQVAFGIHDDKDDNFIDSLRKEDYKDLFWRILLLEMMTCL